LPQERACFVKAEITPAFAKFRFHVFDQKIEAVNIARDGAGDDGRRFGFGLKGQSATHSSVSHYAPVARVVLSRRPETSAFWMRATGSNRSHGCTDRSERETADRKGQQ
jgi:hypothetical protein